MFLFGSPQGGFDALSLLALLMLPPASVLFGWMMQRGGGSVAIAIVLHAGAHLDNINRMPADQFVARIVTIVLMWVVAGLAARSMLQRGRIRM
jgi:hypothetical protein